MSIWRKSISAVTSAALLASILVTAAAPAAFAAISTTSAGNVAVGTTSAGTATLTFTETAVDALNLAAMTPSTQHMYVDILDSASNPTVTWAGTPVVSAPGSLGASATIVGPKLDIKITGRDAANVESITITGLKVTASSAAASGAVKATLSDSNGGLVWQAFYSQSLNAKGKLVGAVGVNATTFDIALDSDSPCAFNTAGATAANPVKIAGANPETIPATGQATATISAVAGGIQTVAAINPTLATPGTTTNHQANDVVTQATGICPEPAAKLAMSAPATVVTAAAFSYSSTPTVFPGESNGVAGDLTVTEPPAGAGFLANGTTLTYTIATAGVVFSMVPTLSDNNSTLAGTIALSADRKSVVVTITAASTVNPAVVTLSKVRYDVAASVPGGTYVEVNLALSGGLLLTGNPATNAIVFRGITATAPTPTVYIGENNQATGLVTLTEQASGFFNSGTGNNNVISVCQKAVEYSYTFAPWAKVTAGDLRLREGAVASPDNIVVGAWDGDDCYTWTVWTGSTVASTIVIGNDTFTTGPLISVKVNQAPGIVAMKIYSGTGANYDDTRIATVGFAVAAFRSQVAVTALSQPTIPAGAVTKAGAIQVAETANGQLKSGEDICFEIMPRGSTGSSQAKYDTLISTLNTAQLPVVTASGGLVVGPVNVSDSKCAYRPDMNGSIKATASNQTMSFAFRVFQQSTAGTGKLVVDNINLITLADAFNGPVLFNVYGYGDSPTKVEFQAQVSNAKIGVKAAVAISSTTALGLMPNQGPWSTSTKVAAANKYITWRFQGGAALAGKLVQIQVAAKNSNGGWGPFVTLTSRLSDASGTAYFQWRSTGMWLSVRAYYPGDVSVAESWSPARQGRWR